MKDLDFDELDRAVNSLMTNVPKTTPQVAESKEKTLDITPTLDADTPPSFNKVEQVAAQAVASSGPVVSTAPKPSGPRTLNDVTPMRSAAPVVTPTRPQPSQTPAARRGSKFMDVVRPTSVATSDDKPVSRQGVTIQPTNPVVPEPTTPKVEEISATSEPAKTSEPAVEAPKNDWPDPLDMQPSQPSSDDNESTDINDDTAATPDETPKTSVVELAQSEPLVSPFLPDAKVEKRPLGSPVPSSDVSLELPTDKKDAIESPALLSDDTTEVPNEKDTNDSLQLPPTPSESDDVKTQLPEELSGDLMAVEADTTHDELKKAHDGINDTSEVPDKSERPDEVESVKAVDKEPVPAAVTGPTSIAQQYHESPSTGDTDSGSIYDTSTYHQPLAHPAKKGSGKKVVIWIVIIVLVGIAAGAALYFSGII